jgi:hypothetical protein
MRYQQPNFFQAGIATTTRKPTTTPFIKKFYAITDVISFDASNIDKSYALVSALYPTVPAFDSQGNSISPSNKFPYVINNKYIGVKYSQITLQTNQTPICVKVQLNMNSIVSSIKIVLTSKDFPFTYYKPLISLKIDPIISYIDLDGNTREFNTVLSGNTTSTSIPIPNTTARITNFFLTS